MENFNWDEIYWGNSLRDYSSFALILLLGFIFSGVFARIFSWVAYRLFRKFSKGKFFDEFLRLLKKPFNNLVQLVIVYAACNRLSFPVEWNIASGQELGLRWLIHTVFLVAIIIGFMRVFKRGVDFMEYVYIHHDESPISPDLATFIRRLVQILIYILGFFVILAKAFEVNITAVITSLGIGGLAIALAAQDTLANLIGSFIIYIDKPFNVGDIVEVGDIRGEVEKIGFRTTRIRTLDRSLLIVPNKKIVDSNLNNISQSNQRRVRFNLALTYSSDPKAILAIIEDIKGFILDEMPLTSDEITVRFIDFDASSLNILVVYFVNSNVYEVKAEVKERINIKILNCVEKHGCKFAYPTQTVYVQSEKN